MYIIPHIFLGGLHQEASLIITLYHRRRIDVVNKSKNFKSSMQEYFFTHELRSFLPVVSETIAWIAVSTSFVANQFWPKHFFLNSKTVSKYETVSNKLVMTFKFVS